MRRLAAALVGVAFLACGQRPAPALADREATGREPALSSPAPTPAAGAPAPAPQPLPASGRPSEVTGTVPAPPKTATPASAGPAAPSSAWTSAPVVRAASGPTALLTAVTAAPQAGFDRVAFDFAGPLPGYRVELASRPVVACGSGDPVELPGTAVLVVAFHGAAAHDDHGQVTVADRDRRPGLPGLVALKLFCDFEGDVSWALALPRATRFRVGAAAAPARLTVDLEHPR